MRTINVNRVFLSAPSSHIPIYPSLEFAAKIAVSLKSLHNRYYGFCIGENSVEKFANIRKEAQALDFRGVAIDIGKRKSYKNPKMAEIAFVFRGLSRNTWILNTNARSNDRAILYYRFPSSVLSIGTIKANFCN